MKILCYFISPAPIDSSKQRGNRNHTNYTEFQIKLANKFIRNCMLTKTSDMLLFSGTANTNHK